MVIFSQSSRAWMAFGTRSKKELMLYLSEGKLGPSSAEAQHWNGLHVTAYLSIWRWDTPKRLIELHEIRELGTARLDRGVAS